MALPPHIKIYYPYGATWRRFRCAVCNDARQRNVTHKTYARDLANFIKLHQKCRCANCGFPFAQHRREKSPLPMGVSKYRCLFGPSFWGTDL